MDYRQRARLNQDNSVRIKHMAFAVKSVDKALLNFQSFLSVSQKTEKVIWEKADTKVAIFFINDIEFQLCESLKGNGRFSEWIEKYGEGLHHICYEVDDIKKVLEDKVGPSVAAHNGTIEFISFDKSLFGSIFFLEIISFISEAASTPTSD